MPQSDGMDSATAFRLASGRFWEIVRLCPLIAGSRRPGRVEARADLEHPGQQRITSLGERDVLCAPTARQTNGLIGVSPENKSRGT